jgi:hypothetical protein
VWPEGTTYRFFGDGTGPAGEPDTGELRLIHDSDDTPDVSFTYDRLGRQREVTDAATGSGGHRTLDLVPAARVGRTHGPAVASLENAEVVGVDVAVGVEIGYAATARQRYRRS